MDISPSFSWVGVHDNIQYGSTVRLFSVFQTQTSMITHQVTDRSSSQRSFMMSLLSNSLSLTLNVAHRFAGICCKGNAPYSGIM